MMTQARISAPRPRCLCLSPVGWAPPTGTSMSFGPSSLGARASRPHSYDNDQALHPNFYGLTSLGARASRPHSHFQGHSSLGARASRPHSYDNAREKSPRSTRRLPPITSPSLGARASRPQFFGMSVTLRSIFLDLPSLGARASRPHSCDNAEAFQATLYICPFLANVNALLYAHAMKCGRDARAPREKKPKTFERSVTPCVKNCGRDARAPRDERPPLRSRGDPSTSALNLNCGRDARAPRDEKSRWFERSDWALSWNCGRDARAPRDRRRDATRLKAGGAYAPIG